MTDRTTGGVVPGRSPRFRDAPDPTEPPRPINPWNGCTSEGPRDDGGTYLCDLPAGHVGPHRNRWLAITKGELAGTWPASPVLATVGLGPYGSPIDECITALRVAHGRQHATQVTLERLDREHTATVTALTHARNADAKARHAVDQAEEALLRAIAG